jgi:hypothetical protein
MPVSLSMPCTSCPQNITSIEIFGAGAARFPESRAGYVSPIKGNVILHAPSTEIPAFAGMAD